MPIVDLNLANIVFCPILFLQSPVKILSHVEQAFACWVHCFLGGGLLAVLGVLRAYVACNQWLLLSSITL